MPSSAWWPKTPSTMRRCSDRTSPSASPESTGKSRGRRSAAPRSSSTSPIATRSCPSNSRRGERIMKSIAWIAAFGLVLFAGPTLAQDDDGGGDGSEYIVVTGSRIQGPVAGVPLVDRRPVVGLRRAADNAVRQIEITSDSREEDMRRNEVEAMFLAALDRAKREGLSLVTGEFEVTEVTRENWRNLFPGLAGSPDPGTDDED